MADKMPTKCPRCGEPPLKIEDAREPVTTGFGDMMPEPRIVKCGTCENGHKWFARDEPVGRATPHTCPRCGQQLAYVKEDPEEPTAQNGKIYVPLASEILSCPDHGLWRVYISGAVKPYRP